MMVRGTWCSDDGAVSSLPTISLSSSGSIRVLCVLVAEKRCSRMGGTHGASSSSLILRALAGRSMTMTDDRCLD